MPSPLLRYIQLWCVKVLKPLAELLLPFVFLLGVFPFIDWLTDGKLVTVTAATAVQGQVSKCYVNRQHFHWYLDGQKVRYDFWDFTAGDAATRQLQARIGRQNQGNEYYYNTLAYYLRVGDVLSKPANSPLLRLQRGDSVTVWTCAPAK